MLNHKQLRLVGALALFTCLLIDWFLPVHWSLYVALAIVFLGFIAYGSANIQSQFFLKTICAGPGDHLQVALTFDDGPDPRITPLILDILKTHQVQAAFFCIGHKMEKHPDLLRRIDTEGHVIGNHSYSHSYFFDLLPYRKVLEELQQTAQILKDITEKKMNFFRPPYGVTNPAIAKAVTQTNQKVIGWNVRSLDTVIKDKEKLLKRIVKKIKPGSIILLHDTHEGLPEILTRLLEYLAQEEFEVVGLDQLIGESAYLT